MEAEGKTLVINLIALGITYAILMFPINALGSYLQVFAAELGASPSIVGTILAIPYVIALFARFIGGYLADVIGRKPVVSYTLLLGILAYIILVIAKNWLYLIPFQILSGLMYLSAAAETSIMSESLPPEKRSTGMTLTQAPTGLSLVIGPILASYVYASTCDIIDTCKFFGEILIFGYLASFFIRLFLIRETKLTKEESSLSDFLSKYKRVFSDAFFNLKAPLFIDIAISMMLGFVIFTQYFAIMYLGIDPESWGYLLSLIAIFVILGAAPGMIIGDKKGRLTAFRIGSLFSVIGFPLVALAKDTSKLIGGISIFFITLTPVESALFLPGIIIAIGYGMGYAVISPYVTELFPKEKRSMGVTVFLSFSDVGLILGFLISGWVYQYIDPRAIYIIASILILIAFFISFKAPETLKRQIQSNKEVSS